MSDQGRATPGEGEAPVNPYSLLEAVNASSDTAHTGWLIFIGILSYLLVAVAGVSHKDLLLSRDIPLPILQVGIELTRFFLFAPFVIVLFHVGLVTQLVMLARKTIELDAALRMVEATDKRTHPLRLELNNFFFVQAIAGPERSAVVNGLLHGLSWLTLVMLPVVVLLYIQLAFLPYHDETTTWAHRIALVADIGLLAFIGVFLSRPEPSLASALWRASRAHPITGMMTVIVLSSVAGFSFLVATIPGEALDRASQRLWPVAEVSAAPGGSRAAFGFTLPFAGASFDGKLFGLFERNLNVTDLDLVIDKDVTPGEPSLNLRRRDLRYAKLDRTDLHQADLTGADLEGASLIGADLRDAWIQCADISLLLLSENREAAGCSRAPGANFTKARLAGASLSGLDLTGAQMEDADLTGGNFAHARLVGANLYGVRAGRVDLTGGVAMQGINLATAELAGADLTGAKLHGADLTSARLQGAMLEFASLEGASLRDADLEGASLFQARLHMADLSGAHVRAASFREARIWQAQPPAAAGADLVDLGAVQPVAPEAAEIAALERMLAGISDARLVARLREAVGPAVKAGQVPAPAGSSGGGEATLAAWRPLLAASTTEPPEPRLANRDGFAAPAPFSGLTTSSAAPPVAIDTAGSVRTGDRRARLSQALVGLACLAKWSDASVGTGVAKRATSPAFNGDAAIVYDGIRQATCPAASAIAQPTLARLGRVVEGLRGR